MQYAPSHTSLGFGTAHDARISRLMPRTSIAVCLTKGATKSKRVHFQQTHKQTDSVDVDTVQQEAHKAIANTNKKKDLYDPFLVEPDTVLEANQNVLAAQTRIKGSNNKIKEAHAIFVNNNCTASNRMEDITEAPGEPYYMTP
eukprot:jgi/Psemu1/1943/gm1.1943_g